ncbi:hypothetical protein [Paenibacillus medicaginis]|uniref:Tetratricopeptide repeat protein n=1 Tax=Paenibacillus medicaginis TaxID=1470560 RepID=A0ABV5CCE6_9BACL
MSALGHTDEAIYALRHALSLGPAPEEYPGVNGYGTYLTCRDLGLLYASAGKQMDADLYLTLASLMSANTRTPFKEHARDARQRANDRQGRSEYIGGHGTDFAERHTSGGVSDSERLFVKFDMVVAAMKSIEMT